MSSVGLNKWIVSGNLAADAEIKTVDLKSGEKAKVAEATMYVRKPRSRDDSFTVRLSIWQTSAAWRKLPYLTKGSLIICTGNVDPTPFISNSDNKPRAGLRMTVVDIDLDNVRNSEEEDEQLNNGSEQIVAKQEIVRQEPELLPNQGQSNGKASKGKVSNAASQATEKTEPIKA